MTDNQQADTDNAGSGDGQGQDDYAELKSAIKQERDARKAAERTLKEANDRLAQLEGKDKSDVERLAAERDRYKAELDAREARLRDLAVTTALTTAATKAGARYPELIVQRVSADAVLDDDLNVKNADKLMTEVKKDYPDLFRVVDGTADGGKGRQDGNTTTSDMNRLLRRNAGYAT